MNKEKATLISLKGVIWRCKKLKIYPLVYKCLLKSEDEKKESLFQSRTLSPKYLL